VILSLESVGSIQSLNTLQSVSDFCTLIGFP
jgi:hypothetical protein